MTTIILLDAEEEQATHVSSSDDEAIQRLIDACRGVPYLATSIYETIERAGLRLTFKDEA